MSIEALIKLIDDPDEQIFMQVKNQLLDIGSDAVPILENSWEQLDYGQLFHSRVENIIHQIQFDSTKTLIKHWIKTPEKDLLTGICYIAKYQFPDLELSEIVAQIDAIERTIWLELNNKLTAYEKVKTLNKVLFEIYGFSGNTKNYTSPYNSYMNSVLETRKGNPLSISVLYSILAQRLSIPIYGVNLPNHFVLAYMDENNTLQSIGEKRDNSGIFFYINAFSNGSLFSREDIDVFLEKLKMPQKKEFYEPCSNSAILIRMLNNLIYSYSELKKPEKVEELTLLRDCF